MIIAIANNNKDDDNDIINYDKISVNND